MPSIKFKTVDEYIATFPKTTQKLLNEMRSLIRSLAPEAEEVISYNMPAFKLHTILVYYAGYKAHIGFYPSGSGIRAFESELTGCKYSKGAIQFPLDKPLPVELITKIVRLRIMENEEKFREKNRESKGKKKS